MMNEGQGQTIDVNMQNDKAKYLHYTAKREMEQELVYSFNTM